MLKRSGQELFPSGSKNIIGVQPGMVTAIVAQTSDSVRVGGGFDSHRTEVSQLELSLVVYEQILWFEVSV